MSQPDVCPKQAESPDPQRPGAHSRGGHGSMMIACCIPMLVIATVLVATGASVGFILVALMCPAMMALMMGAMSGGSGKQDESQRD
jgi:hypothetical protein